MTNTSPTGCVICTQPARYAIPLRLHRSVHACDRHYPLVWRRHLGPRRWRRAYLTQTAA